VKKFIDLFAGIGGFHLAFHRAGARCEFASETDPTARKIYEANFKAISPKIFDNFNSDILKISPKDIPDHDILCAGFPCQPFSQAGYKKGFDEKYQNRGNMFSVLADIIDEKRPKAIFLENVRHLLKHDKCKTFSIILNTLENDLKYRVYYKIIKASDFGLPQHRPRIYIVGFRKEEIYPATFEFPPPVKLTSTLSDVIGGDCDREIGYTLRVGGRGARIDDRRNWDCYSVDGVIRRIGPTEGKKLMGFPGDFILPESEGAAMKLLGNSVAVSAVEAVATKIIKYLGSRLLCGPPPSKSPSYGKIPSVMPPSLK
jgi:DNA (cytosine-5)-methyltransferase 1